MPTLTRALIQDVIAVWAGINQLRLPVAEIEHNYGSAEPFVAFRTSLHIVVAAKSF